jgi:uncharacterized protein (TIGR02466 family)
MMNIGPVFASFLASEQTSNLVDPVDVTQACLDLRKHQTKDVYEQEGGWQSGFIQHPGNLQPLVDLVMDRAEYLTRNLIKIKPEYPVTLDSWWININDPGVTHEIHNNPPHLHANQFISFVYYPYAKPQCGTLTLSTPSSVQEYIMPRYMLSEDQNEFNSTRMHIYPEPGLLVAFPSYLMHHVGANNSGDTRISIAFNVSLPHQDNSHSKGSE